MQRLSITTPEHVQIALEPAGAGSRCLALLIDAAVVLAIGSFISSMAMKLLPGGAAYALFLTVQFVLTFGWHVWFETKRQGRTPGKRMMRLRVIDARGLPVSLYQSLVRNIMRVVDSLPVFYGVAAATTMLNPSRRRLGDLVADTVVVRDALPLAWQGHAAIGGRDNSLRTPRVQRAIRHRITLEEREFLVALVLRAPKLTPAARYDLMEEVAAMYRQRLGIEDVQISGENLVRDLVAVMFERDDDSRAALPRVPMIR